MAIHIQQIYQEVALLRPDLIDNEPDTHAPTQLKWQHDLRWELQSAVTARRILKRTDVGRGYYSGVADPDQVLSEGLDQTPTVKVAPIEQIRAEQTSARAATDAVAVSRDEVLLVTRFEEWALAKGRTIGRVEFRTSDGERLVADAYEPRRRLLIEAKASYARPFIRMAIGQLLDYRLQLGIEAPMAVLLPKQPPPSIVDLLKSCGIGLIVEIAPGEFAEQLV